MHALITTLLLAAVALSGPAAAQQARAAQIWMPSWAPRPPPRDSVDDLKTLANAGDPEGKYCFAIVGKLFNQAANQPDVEGARTLLEEAAADGYWRANLVLRDMFLPRPPWGNGTPIPTSPPPLIDDATLAKMDKVMARLASANDPQATISLAQYRYSRQRPKEALELLKAALPSSGRYRCTVAFELGMLNPPSAEAITQFRDAATRGHPAAMSLLAWNLKQKGNTNVAEEYRWLLKAMVFVPSGFPSAPCELAEGLWTNRYRIAGSNSVETALLYARIAAVTTGGGQPVCGRSPYLEHDFEAAASAEQRAAVERRLDRALERLRPWPEEAAGPLPCACAYFDCEAVKHSHCSE